MIHQSGWDQDRDQQGGAAQPSGWKSKLCAISILSQFL